MAYNFVRTSSQFLEIPSVGALTSKFSGGAWARLSSLTAGQSYTVVNKTSGVASDQRNFAIYYIINSAKWEISWAYGGGGTYAAYNFSHTPTIGTWYHIAFTVDWTTNPDTVVGYVNGASQSLSMTGSNDTTPKTGTVTGIGCYDQGDAHGSFFDGDIAELFILNDVLAADQVAALAKGFTLPALGLPGSKVEAYHPLVRGKQELYRGRTATDGTAAPTPSAHPRVFLAK